MRQVAFGAIVGGLMLISGQVLIEGAKTLGFTGALCVGVGLVMLGVSDWRKDG